MELNSESSRTLKKKLLILFIALRGALRKEVRGHSFEELAIWPFLSPFPPLPHYLSYLTRLNNFGMVARFLYANEAPIQDLVRFHPPGSSRLPGGSLASPKFPNFVRGSPLTWSRHRLWTPPVTSDYSLANSFHLSKVVKGDARIACATHQKKFWQYPV